MFVKKVLDNRLKAGYNIKAHLMESGWRQRRRRGEEAGARRVPCKLNNVTMKQKCTRRSTEEVLAETLQEAVSQLRRL